MSEDWWLNLKRFRRFAIPIADAGKKYIAVMNTSDYVDQVEKDLHQSKTYKGLKSNKLTTVTNKVKKLLKEMHSSGMIDEDLRKYMNPTKVQEGKVKANPKIHKEGAPIRTIVSGINHPTEKLAEIAEAQLEEWVTSLPSYIKDTTHFLNKIEEVNKTLGNHIIMFAMDVKSPYPSIPRQPGLQACKEALEQRSDKNIPTDAVINMIQTVLDNNIFKFKGKDYIQIEGTAIGSRLGRNYACMYMGKWEQELLSRATLTPTMYVRYVDDIFGLWPGTEQQLKEFHEIANNINDNIKVDLRTSDNELEFLDVLVKYNQNNLHTTIYHKPTDKNIYVHRTSEHPRTVKKAIPYGLGIRARRICSTDAEYKLNKDRIVQNLKRQGYPEKATKKVLDRVDDLDRNNLLKYNTRKTSSRVPLTVTYSNKLPNLQHILHSRLPVLQRSSRMKHIFPQAPITAYKRDSNLQDILVHKKAQQSFR